MRDAFGTVLTRSPLREGRTTFDVSIAGRRVREAGSSAQESFLSQGIKQFNYLVEDVARAKALFSALLGVEPYADESYYAGIRVGEQEIRLDPNGPQAGMTGPTVPGGSTGLSEMLGSAQ